MIITAWEIMGEVCFEISVLYLLIFYSWRIDPHSSRQIRHIL